MLTRSIASIGQAHPLQRGACAGRLQLVGWRRAGIVGSLVLGVFCGCHDVSQPLPSGTENPAFYNTPAGALGMRNAVIVKVEQGLPSYIIDTGLLTDELIDLGIPSHGVGDELGLDKRNIAESGLASGGSSVSNDYATLQSVRAEVNQALGAFARYDTIPADSATSKVHRAELYALEGYAEILLADFYCSGVPLSTLDFQGDFTYQPSSTTDDVYQDAIAKLDSAQQLADTSTQVLNLARVLQGRAWLARGMFSQAAQAVVAVPDGFQYQLATQWYESNGFADIINNVATVADGEGGNGLPFVTADPRAVVQTEGSFNGISLTFPSKYAAGLGQSSFAPFTVADWIEAHLIRAEAALQAHEPVTWLTELNVLRKTATVPGQTVTPLDTLTDPGSDTARASLLFRERAYWLFLTGHRQGDLRRQLRPPYNLPPYNRRQDQVYPSGLYLGPGSGRYGTDVTVPIPPTEDPNPYFHGCLDRNP